MQKIELFLYIETIPAQSALKYEFWEKHAVPPFDLSVVKPDARLEDPEKIEADIAAKREKATADYEIATSNAAEAAEAEWRKTALDGGRGHIACASFAVNEQRVEHVINTALYTSGNQFMCDVDFDYGSVIRQEMCLIGELIGKIETAINRERLALSIADIEERGKDVNPESIARELPRYPNEPIILAHFSDFDIRFIWQRAIINGALLPEWWPINFSKYRDDQVVETMTQWAGVGTRSSLDRLCEALRVPGKSNIDGSRTWDAVAAGRLDDVVEYCDDDVRRLRAYWFSVTRRCNSVDCQALRRLSAEEQAQLDAEMAELQGKQDEITAEADANARDSVCLDNVVHFGRPQ